MRLQQSILVTMSCVLLASAVAFAQTKEDERRAEIASSADATLQQMFTEIEGSKALYDKAAGYAVFAATKAGFFVSGGGGSGVAVDKTSGDPVYMKMGMGGVGLTFGAEKYDLVVLFETPERLKAFIDGGWDGGAAAKAMAVGESAGAGIGFIDGALVFTLDENGLMASADVSGTRYWVDEDLN